MQTAQTSIFQNEKQNTEQTLAACVFTGHRKLGEDFSARKLKFAIRKLIKRGVHTFYNGMAIGFDLLAAEKLIELKKEYPQVRLVACIPCYHQEKSFSERDKKRYVEILKKADEQILLSERYFRGCMQARDKYMAERADCMIAYCEKETGGAAYTVKIFQKLHPDGEILFL